MYPFKSGRLTAASPTSQSRRSAAQGTQTSISNPFPRRKMLLLRTTRQVYELKPSTTSALGIKARATAVLLSTKTHNQPAFFTLGEARARLAIKPAIRTAQVLQQVRNMSSEGVKEIFTEKACPRKFLPFSQFAFHTARRLSSRKALVLIRKSFTFCNAFLFSDTTQPRLTPFYSTLPYPNQPYSTLVPIHPVTLSLSL